VLNLGRKSWIQLQNEKPIKNYDKQFPLKCLKCGAAFSSGEQKYYELHLEKCNR
jgi:hypothetical protein